MIRFLAIQHTFAEFCGALEPQFEALYATAFSAFVKSQ
jgi:hypothetical protein